MGYFRAGGRGAEPHHSRAAERGQHAERRGGELRSPAVDTLLEFRAPPLRSSWRAASGSCRSACLSDEEVLQYREAQASGEQLLQIDEHIDRCVSCRELIEVVLGEELDGIASAPAPLAFPPGTLVAKRYRVERFVGRGGMGEVYAALDQRIGRRVALKTVLCTAADDPRFMRKLLDEVANAQRVAHPHVCRIYDLHEHADARGALPFFTMELLEGETLAERLRRGPLPLGLAQRLARDMLEGLRAAHARGVLHLDLKSENVMLRSASENQPLRREAGAGSPPGWPEAVIMDFGLSRASDIERPASPSERQQTVGTLPYMAPEQLEGRPELTAASDVYSFGVVLYEMLTGQVPFGATSTRAMLLAQRSGPLRPSRCIPRLSAQLDAFVLRCLSCVPERRFDSAEGALAALQRVGNWEPPRPATRRQRFAALLGPLVLVGGIASAWRLGQERARLVPAERERGAHSDAPGASVIPAALPENGGAERPVSRGSGADLRALLPRHTRSTRDSARRR